MIIPSTIRHPLTRRDFLKIVALGAGTLAFRPFVWLGLPELQLSELTGRITIGKVNVYARPNANSQILGVLYEDQVVSWIREVVGSMPGRINQRWIETSYGYVWGGSLQPVHNLPNLPLNTLPSTSPGSGMWVEVTVPYVELILDNPPSRAPWLQYWESIGLPARFVYSQVVWVDQVRMDENNQVWYRLNERYGSGDLFWSPAEAFRPLTTDEIAPINPEAEEKRIVVNIDYQTLSCFEGKNEVYFARI
ncbi:MAG: twin-arginine translocation signal domain-containing protein, partial [Anaerolineales bacterium]